VITIGSQRHEKVLQVPDHAEAVRQCLAQLTDPQSRAQLQKKIGLAHLNKGDLPAAREFRPLRIPAKFSAPRGR